MDSICVNGYCLEDGTTYEQAKAAWLYFLTVTWEYLETLEGKLSDEYLAVTTIRPKFIQSNKQMEEKRQSNPL